MPTYAPVTNVSTPPTTMGGVPTAGPGPGPGPSPGPPVPGAATPSPGAAGGSPAPQTAVSIFHSHIYVSRFSRH